MTFLASKGPALEGFVCAGLVSLLARITKLGWFENPSQGITKDVNQFLTVSIDHCIIGLQVTDVPCFFIISLSASQTLLPLLRCSNEIKSTPNPTYRPNPTYSAAWFDNSILLALYKCRQS